MTGIDLLLAKSLSSKIKSNLESEVENKLKIKLFKKYGLSIKQSIENFSKFEEVLKEFLNANSTKFEEDCLFEILSLGNLKKDLITVTIKDKNLSELFMESFGDKESRKIIEQTLRNPLLISEILEACKLSQTSGYRKINAMIRNGLLIKSGHELTNKKRAIDKFSMFCKKINIEIQKDKCIIKVTVPKKTLDESTVIQTILN